MLKTAKCRRHDRFFNPGLQSRGTREAAQTPQRPRNRPRVCAHLCRSAQDYTTQAHQYQPLDMLWCFGRVEQLQAAVNAYKFVTLKSSLSDLEFYDILSQAFQMAVQIFYRTRERCRSRNGSSPFLNDEVSNGRCGTVLCCA